MATKTATQLKLFFETGDKPTSAEFGHVMDSHLNLTDGGTVTGASTFSADNTFSGANTFSGLNTFTGGLYGGAAKVLAAEGTHNNTTTAGDASATVTIAANTLVAGNAIHVKSYGRVVDNNSTDTLTPVLKIGSTAIGTGAALDVADSDLVRLDCWITIRTIGSSGTFVADGTLETDAVGGTKLLFTKASTTIDTTAAQILAMNFDWSAAHGDNEYTQDQFIVTIH